MGGERELVCGDVYYFGNFTLDVPRRLLVRDERRVALTPRAFDLLCILVANAGRLVSKHALLDHVWGTAQGSESTRAQHIYMLRRALGDDASSDGSIVTVFGAGYRFKATVRARKR